MRGFSIDLTQVLRGLRRAPGFTAAAVLTIAIGVGANTAIFSVVNAVLLEPLPYANPERIVSVWNAWDDTPKGRLSPAEYYDYLERVATFEHFGVYTTGFDTLTVTGAPERVPAVFVSHGVLPALGVAPALGRLFTPDDDAPGSDVVLITDGAWRTRFGAAPDVIGRQIMIDNRPRTVVGVLASEFRLPEDLTAPDPVQIVEPLGLSRANLPGRGSHFLKGVARVSAGTTPEQASSQMAAVATQFAREFPAEYPPALRFTAGVTPLHDDIVGPVRATLLTLLGAIAFVLLIACGNITHLFLSRGESRRDEFAIRVALGAARARLVRLTLLETTVVALSGGALGLGFAAMVTRLVVAMSPPDVPRLDTVAIDLTVIAFGLLASLFVGLVVGLTPALRLTFGRAMAAGVDGRGIAGGAPARHRVRRMLIGSEVALAIVLTLGAGLMVKSLLQLLAVEPGYQTTGVLTASIGLPQDGYDSGERTAAFFTSLLDRLRGQPGVVSAGAVSGLPLTQPLGDLNFQIEGRETAQGQRSRRADWQVVTPGYFEALGMRLIEGRGIEETDRVNTPGVVVINQATARLHWPAGDALNKRMRLGGGAGPGWVTVVGIVNDIRHATLRVEPKPEMYLAHTQFRFWGTGEPVRDLHIVMRVEGDPAGLAHVLRREVAELDPRLPVSAVQTMDAIRSTSLAPIRFVSVLLSMFAGVALSVTLVGIYGVMAYAVAQRRREIGVRVALGAAPSSVVGLVLRQGLVPAGAGIAGGVAGGIALSGVLRDHLYAVTPGDVPTAALVSALVGVVALLACGIPAARAARVDPATALRAD